MDSVLISQLEATGPGFRALMVSCLVFLHIIVLWFSGDIHIFGQLSITQSTSVSTTQLGMQYQIGTISYRRAPSIGYRALTPPLTFFSFGIQLPAEPLKMNISGHSLEAVHNPVHKTTLSTSVHNPVHKRPQPCPQTSTTLSTSVRNIVHECPPHYSQPFP